MHFLPVHDAISFVILCIYNFMRKRGLRIPTAVNSRVEKERENESVIFVKRFYDCVPGLRVAVVF